MKTQYLSTSIPYINAEPHIGFLFELVATDVLARFYRQTGVEVFFLTGVDEHGTKIAQAIEKSGQTAAEYTNKLAGQFQQLSRDFAITNDLFIRTTGPKHVDFAQKVWRNLDAAGVIKKGRYEGWYCVGCEAFKTDKEIENGCCLIHKTPLEQIVEENYYLEISAKTKDAIRVWLDEALYPPSRKSEVLNYLKEIDRVSISRPMEKLSWGVPVPGDETQTMYVWVDALSSYLSGIDAASKKIADFWPGVQVIGKDILKFHTVIWPAMLLALDYKLPQALLVHGFVNVDGQKMSKSVGNVIAPEQLKKRYGAEATRYLLLRQLNFWQDSNFVWSEFDALYNGELANGIGNLVARVVGLLKKVGRPINIELLPVGSLGLRRFDFAASLNQINEQVSEADKIITAKQLWLNLAEDKAKQVILISLGEKLLALADLLVPFMPETAASIREQLKNLEAKPLFPRLEKE